MTSIVLRFSRFDDLYEPQPGAAARRPGGAEAEPDASDRRTDPTHDDDRIDVRVRRPSGAA